MRKIYLLWTGGWDSTFRLIQAAREPENLVQPIYVVSSSSERLSIPYEKRAQKTILEKLAEDKNIKGKILPVKEVLVSDIPADDEITGALEKIREDILVGKQYDYLARYAKSAGVHLELAVEWAENPANFDKAMKKYCVLKWEDGVQRIDSEKSSREGASLFRYFDFPIYHLTENDMIAELEKWGELDIMKNIWFCAEPLNGEPCGTCSTCIQKIRAGMHQFFSEDALKRSEKFLELRTEMPREQAKSIARTMYLS